MPKEIHPISIVYAVRYWHAARTIADHWTGHQLHMLEPVYHLLCHSIELSLKWFLSNKLDLKEREALTKDPNLRHDLEGLYKLAEQHGLRIRVEDQGAIYVMSKAHKEFYLRYGFQQMQIADYTVFMLAASRLIDTVMADPQVLRNGYGPDETVYDWPVDLQDSVF